MNDRIKIINEKGIEILFVDYSGLKPKELIDMSEEVREYLLSRPPSEPIPLIIDSTNIYMTREFRDHTKTFDEDLDAHFGKERVLKNPVVVIGVTGIKRTLLNVFVREMVFRDNLDEAKQYILKKVKTQ